MLLPHWKLLLDLCVGFVEFVSKMQFLFAFACGWNEVAHFILICEM